MTDYSYQTHSADKVLENTLKQGVKAAVLAATPGSGKTAISHLIISRYLKKYPEAKVLVLTHGQNLLKDQYIDSLKNPHTEIDFTFSDFAPTEPLAQVYIGLPQAIKKLPLNKIDLLIVDECHEFYLKKMVQNIIKDLDPKHQVLLTGSPSEFNRLRKLGKRYEMTYISGNDLVDNDVFSNVEMVVVPVDYKKNSRKSLIKMLDHAKRKKKNLSKIMVTVSCIKEAHNVAYHLKSIGRNVALSTCKNDRSSHMVKEFKAGSYDTLVVVQRGILGFSDNNITGLFDLRCSDNLDISNQLFARVLRKHPDDVLKFYYRCGEKKSNDFNDQVIMLYKVKSMMRREVFTKYDGTNLNVRVG